jgi:hypothetical protein
MLEQQQVLRHPDGELLGQSAVARVGGRRRARAAAREGAGGPAGQRARVELV